MPPSQLVRSNNSTGHWWHVDMPWTWHDLAKLPLQQKLLHDDRVVWWYGYGSIPIDTFLVGWTSIYQLFWGSLGTMVLTHPHIVSWSHLKLQGKPMSDLSHSITNCQSNHHNSYHRISSHTIYDIINHRNLRNAPCFVAVVLGAFCCCSLALWCCGANRTSWLCLATGTEGSRDGPSVTQRFQRFRL